VRISVLYFTVTEYSFLWFNVSLNEQQLKQVMYVWYTVKVSFWISFNFSRKYHLATKR